MLMVWDEPKRKTNLEDHGLEFADARDRFDWATAIVGDTYPNPKTGKPRFFAVGYLDADLVFEQLGTEAISAVSLRSASNRERRLYAKR